MDGDNMALEKSIGVRGRICSRAWSGLPFERWCAHAIFLLVAAVIFSIVLVELVGAFDWESYPFQPQSELPLAAGLTVEGKIYPKAEAEAIHIYFGTQGRENRGTLHIRLLEDGEEIAAWEYDTDRLLDHAYQEFELDKPLKSDWQTEYSVVLWAEYEKEGPVSVWSGKSDAGEKTSLCYGLTYRDQQKRDFAIFASSVLFLIVVVWILAGGEGQRLMCMLFLFLVLLHVWLLPIFAVDDEGPHFQRAYQISTGTFFSPVWNEMSSPRDHGGFGGCDRFPQALYEFPSNEDARIDSAAEVKDVCFFARYFPLSYAPHAFGIWIARLLTNRVKLMFYAARLCGALLASFLCIRALRRMPFGKELLFIIMILPKSIEQFAGITADSLLLACVLLFLSEILRLSYQENNLKKGDRVLLMCLAVALSLFKSAYVGLILLLFLIPDERFESKDIGRIWRACAVCCALVFGIYWSIASTNLYLFEVAAGVDATSQVRNILMDLPAYCKMVARHMLFEILPPDFPYQTNIYNFIKQAVSISVCGVQIDNTACPVGFLLLFLYQLLWRRDVPEPHSAKDPYLLLGAVLICGAMVVTSLYAAFSPVGSDWIPLCGRYFLPLLLPTALFVLLMRKRFCPELQECCESHRPNTYIYLCVIGLQGISIFSVVSHLSAGIVL